MTPSLCDLLLSDGLECSERGLRACSVLALTLNYLLTGGGLRFVNI